MKKIISLILVMALALVVFSGCVSKAPPVEDTAGNSGDTAAPKYKMTFYCKKYGSKFLS